MKKTLQLTICMALVTMLGVGNLFAQAERFPPIKNKQTVVTNNEITTPERGATSETFICQRTAFGWIKGTVANPFGNNVAQGNMGKSVQCMEYINGVLYGIDWASVGKNHFGTINPATGAWSNIKSNFASDGAALCWNPVDNKVYVMPWSANDSESTVFGTVDLATGNVTTIATLPKDGEHTFYMAIDNDGVAYAVRNMSDEFGKIDLATGNFTVISHFPDFDANFISNMSIDRETNELYWCALSGDWDDIAKYFRINKVTGELTELIAEADFMATSFSILNAIVVQCDPATNLVVNYTPDCKAELSWTAPGDNANAKYNIYRDGASIKQNHAEKTFTDEGFDVNAEHTWVVKAICSDGNESAALSKNVPACKSCLTPTNFVAEYINNCGAVNLTWVAPAEGVKYNVYRGDEKIASAISETTFTDDTFENTGHTWKVKTVCEDAESVAASMALPICVGINENGISFSIVPNPATNDITIKTDVNFSKVEVINFLGQVVISETTNKIDVTNLTSGVYFVRIVSENGTSVQKFVKK